MNHDATPSVHADVDAGVRSGIDAGIRAGIGGWTYEPWRGTFYPDKLPHSRELQHASRHVTAIEINGTYYRLQSKASFAKWRDETPDDFVFSLKATRYTTNRRVLAEAGESIEKFMASGLSELGAKLGPIVWQFAPTKAFDPEDFEAFLALLPPDVDGLPLRHVMDVRHPSFMTEDYLALARRHKVATVFTDSADYPSFADLTGDLVYGRLMRSQPDIETGYKPAAIRTWAERARTWAEGKEPADVPRVAPAAPASTKKKAAHRDVFIFFINGAKERAPAAAQAFIHALGKA